MHNETVLPLRPVHASRREVPGAGGCDGFETLRRLRAVEAALERRLPGASRWIDHFRPYTDSRGVWQLPAVFGRKPVVDLPFLLARSRELTLQLQAAETQVESLKADLRSVEATVDAAGLRAELAAARAPRRNRRPFQPHASGPSRPTRSSSTVVDTGRRSIAAAPPR